MRHISFIFFLLYCCNACCKHSFVVAEQVRALDSALSIHMNELEFAKICKLKELLDDGKSLRKKDFQSIFGVPWIKVGEMSYIYRLNADDPIILEFIFDKQNQMNKCFVLTGSDAEVFLQKLSRADDKLTECK